MPKITSNSVSLAGEFAVLSQLALRGYDANMTLGHTKSVDILVSHPRTFKMYQLEVKTTLGKGRSGPWDSKMFGHTVCEWMLNEKHERITSPSLFYCFVRLSEGSKESKFFIVPSKIVASYVKKSHALWLRSKKSHKNTSMRTFRIGVKGHPYKLRPPFAEEYEDNWDFGM